MTHQRVFVLWTHPLFKDAIFRLLEHPDIELVGENCNYAQADSLIERSAPDLILVEEQEEPNSPDVYRLLKSPSLSARIVLLSLADNQVIVYDRKQTQMSHSNDLIELCLSKQED